jgi:hypothetical protein
MREFAAGEIELCLDWETFCENYSAEFLVPVYEWYTQLCIVVTLLYAMECDVSKAFCIAVTA